MTEPEVVDAPLEVCDLVHFYPSDKFCESFALPKARYAAVCIGTQQNKLPILRVFNPRPVHTKPRSGRPIKVQHIHSGMVLEVGAPQGVAMATSDITIWCDEERSLGTWEKVR